MKNIDHHSKVGEIVAGDYRAASVFAKFNIDFCCGGGRSIREICSSKDLDEAVLLKELEALEAGRGDAVANFNDWELSFLIDYIVNKHHLYVTKKLPELSAYAEKVAKVHGGWRPETIEVARLFKALSQELVIHMDKEENVLFPYVKMMAKAKKQGTELPMPPFGTVRHPIRVMEQEHDFAGETMRRIRVLTDHFTPPDGACTTYRVLYANLQEFETNLHEHIHLENNILFPKAFTLEGSLFH